MNQSGQEKAHRPGNPGTKARIAPAARLTEMLPEHIDPILRIDQLTGMTPWSAADFGAVLADSTRWAGWVLLPVAPGKSPGDPAAYALMVLIPPEAELSKIAVHPDFQRRGWAALLLHRAASHAFNKGCRSLFLEVRSRNLIAINFYRQQGFSACGLRKRYYRDPEDDALLMVCSLGQIRTDAC